MASKFFFKVARVRLAVISFYSWFGVLPVDLPKYSNDGLKAQKRPPYRLLLVRFIAGLAIHDWYFTALFEVERGRPMLKPKRYTNTILRDVEET